MLTDFRKVTKTSYVKKIINFESLVLYCKIKILAIGKRFNNRKTLAEFLNKKFTYISSKKF